MASRAASWLEVFVSRRALFSCLFCLLNPATVVRLLVTPEFLVTLLGEHILGWVPAFPLGLRLLRADGFRVFSGLRG